MNKHFVKYGLYAGGASILITLLLYVIDPKIMLQVSNWIIFILSVVFMVMAAKGKRSEQGGFISFKEAFTESWLTYLVYALVSLVFTYLLFNVIDPDLKDTVKEIAMEAMEKMSGLLGEEGTAKAIEELEKQDSFSIGGLAQSTAFALVFGALISLIIAAVVKKEKPADWDKNDVIDSNSDSNIV